MANIIITGANQGIGYYFTEQALKDGNRVAVLDIETDHLKDLAQVFPKQLLCCKADVCDDIQIDTAVKEIVAVFSSIDIAIHNACLCTFANENDTELNMYERVFNVNYYGGLRLAKRVLPYMQEQKRGKIIFTSSGVGVTGFIGISPYPFAHNENHSYHGPLSMYKKNGFEVCGQIEGCIVCRKIL